MIALAVVSCLGGLLLIAGGIVGWKLYKSPEGQRMAPLVGESQKYLEEAATAPGTKELASPLCKRGALVVDFERRARLERLIKDASANTPPVSPRFEVICAVDAKASPPACNAVASTYVAAVGRGPGDFYAVVKAGLGAEPACASLYDPAGRFIRFAPEIP